MTTTAGQTAQDLVTTQVYKIYIKASAERIWQAITDPDWNSRFGYGGRTSYDLRPGGRFEGIASPEFVEQARARGQELPEVVVDGEVLEVEAPHRLVVSFRMNMDPDLVAEGYTRLSYDIRDCGGYCSLTVTHALSDTPKLAMILGGAFEAEGAGGGHAWVWSDLKSLLEGGAPLAPPRIS